MRLRPAAPLALLPFADAALAHAWMRVATGHREFTDAAL